MYAPADTLLPLSASMVSLTTTPGTDQYPLGVEFISVHHALLHTNDGLQKMLLHFPSRPLLSTATGEPTGFFLTGSTLTLYPLPDSAYYRISIHGIRRGKIWNADWLARYETELFIAQKERERTA